MIRGFVEVVVPRIHRIFGCGLEGHLRRRRSQDVGLFWCRWLLR